jgi:hypothetical protein
MKQKKVAEYKRKYHAFRHHAWAGLGFLAILGTIRLIAPQLSEVLMPVIILVLLYSLIALIFTYRYYTGITADVEPAHSSESLEKEKIHADLEKERLKLEKKKAKVEAKAKKKRD